MKENNIINNSGNEFKFDLGDVVHIDLFGNFKKNDWIGLIVEKVKYKEHSVFYNVLINSKTTWIHECNLYKV